MPTPQSTPPVPESSLLLSAVEVAALLGVSRAHVWRMNSSGGLPEPVRLGKAVRWRRCELEAWVAAGAPSREKWHSHSAPLFHRP